MSILLHTEDNDDAPARDVKAIAIPRVFSENIQAKMKELGLTKLSY